MRLLRLLLAASLIGCGGADSPPTGPSDQPTSVPTTILLAPSALTFQSFGDTVRIVATIRDQQGHEMSGVNSTWTASDPSVASVTSGGLVAAVGNGTATITVKAGAADANASVTVAQVPHSLVLSTDTLVFAAVGDTASLEVTAFDAGGSPIVGASPTWSSSSTQIASVSPSGRVTAAGPGVTIVTAAVGAVTGTVVVVVNPPVASLTLSAVPETLHVRDTTALSAVGRDEDGNVLDDLDFLWTSSDTSVASVTGGGVVVGRRRGTTQISVRAGNAVSSADLTVIQPVVSASIEGLPDRPRVGDAAQLTARALDRDGFVVQDAVVAWSSTDPTVAQVSAQGQLSTVGVGRANIVLSVEGVTARHTLRVRQALVQVSVGNWERVGPVRIPGITGYVDSGKIQAVAFDPDDPQVLFIGGGVGSGDAGPYTEAGAFRSRDGGKTWTRIDTGLGSLSINQIFTHSTLAGAILVGTEEDGIYRSGDEGDHWTRVYGGNNWPQSTASDFGVLGDELLAATGVGILSSGDRGRTWKVSYPGGSDPFRVLEVQGDLAVAASTGGEVVEKTGSTDWRIIKARTGRTVNSIAISRTNPDDISIVQVTATGPAKVFGTTNGGATWVEENSCNTACTIEYDDSGRLWLGCGEGLMKKVNGSWTAVPGHFASPGKPAWDIRRLQAAPGGRLLVGSDQGMFSMDLGTGVFSELTANLAVSILFSAAVHGSTFLTTIQDFSPLTSFDGGGTWDQRATQGLGAGPAVGEGGTARINPGDSKYCYVFTGSGLQVSSDNCHTFRWVEPTGLGNGSYVQPGPRGIIAFDPNDPARVYASARTGVYRSLDHGWTMTHLTWPFTNVTVVAVRPGDSSQILVGGAFGLSRSTDGGMSWAPVALPDTDYPEVIAFNPGDPDEVLIGTNRGIFYGGGLLRSEDGGATFVRNNGSGLPPTGHQGGYIQQISFGPGGGLVVATSGGLFASGDQGDSWSRVGPSPATVFVSDVSWADGYLYVTTYGQGLLRAPVSIARK